MKSVAKILRVLKTPESANGSAAVLLTVLFSCLILLATALFAASKAAAGRSCIDAALQSAGRSVLSEYDKKLFADYGLFAFKGDGAQMEKDIAFYANASLKKDKTMYAFFTAPGTKTGVFDYGTDAVTANLKEYSLMNVDLFEAQINEAALSEWIREKKDGSAGGSPGESGGSSVDKEDGGRTLRNVSVIENLPSEGLTDTFLFDPSTIRLPSLSEMFDATADKVRTSEYVVSVFKHANGGAKNRDTFFDNEVEYILSGKMSDESNYASVKMKLYLLRFFLNNAALLADSSKMNVVRSLAAPFAAAFEVGELVAEAIIVEAWVVAETQNDLQLLEEGKNVAFAKTSDTWATRDIEKILEGFTDDEAVVPANSAGQSYKDYLRLLLFLTDRETKILRIMDLIQINLKGTYDKAFRLRDHYVGFRFEATVDGKVYAYTERYGKDGSE
ncbi:MAG: DUF5702 domain-containing protein [Clostridiales Family XIII bacterium]|jgi:hypothetical protein|nr:DUF5702 domain-containing protein [Clostridiales Family XIII bacterium]